MRPVAIVTDSASAVPRDYQEQLGIHVAPNVLLWSGQAFRDEIDIQPEQFYARLRTDPEPPTTSAVPPAAFKALFAELLDSGRDVLAVLTGAKLSAIYANACQARDDLGAGEPGRGTLTLIDANTTTMMTGWAAIRAARAARNGADLAGCEAIARHALASTNGYMAVDSLDYLRRGGRIGSAQLLVGTALKLKPVLSVVDGRLVAVARVRTFGRALQHMLDLVGRDTLGKTIEGIAVLHADALDRASELLNAAVERFNPAETVLSYIGPNLGAHSGPGAVIIVYLTAP